MSISKQRLDELAIEVAKRFDQLTDYLGGDFQLSGRQMKDFAHALLAAVEAELKPVTKAVRKPSEASNSVSDSIGHYLPIGMNLISLPLIKEKS